MTGLEPAASPPPAVRATNCATSRNLSYTKPQGWLQRLIFPALLQGGCSQSISTEMHHLNSLSYDIRKIIHVAVTLGLILIIRYPTIKIFEKISTKNWITETIKPPITLLARSTMPNTNNSPYCSINSIPRRTNSGANA